MGSRCIKGRPSCSADFCCSAVYTPAYTHTAASQGQDNEVHAHHSAAPQINSSLQRVSIRGVISPSESLVCTDTHPFSKHTDPVRPPHTTAVEAALPPTHFTSSSPTTHSLHFYDKTSCVISVSTLFVQFTFPLLHWRSEQAPELLPLKSTGDTVKSGKSAAYDVAPRIPT